MHRPWFLTEKQWQMIYEMDVTAVEQWRPPHMRNLMEAARAHCHPFEVSLLGHYHLSYGRYSTEIHAYQNPDGLGPRCEDEVLWLWVLAVLHRLAEIVEYEQGAIQDLVARVIKAHEGDFRFDGPPSIGDHIAILGDSERGGRVSEVSRDASVATVTLESDGKVEIRRVIELVNHE